VAQTVYTPPYIATLGNRAVFYERIALMLRHLDALDINLVSIVRNGNSTVTITVDKPIADEQLAHLGIT
jgi:hypothetical protein